MRGSDTRGSIADGCSDRRNLQIGASEKGMEACLHRRILCFQRADETLHTSQITDHEQVPRRLGGGKALDSFWSKGRVALHHVDDDVAVEKKDHGWCARPCS